jgi:hypothetical protein
MKENWIPEIYYEEDSEGLTKGLPFISVPNDKFMPTALFICEIRDAEDEKKDMAIHMFANMSALKVKLNSEVYDDIRIALGLKPLEEAITEGKKINLNIENKIN